MLVAYLQPDKHSKLRSELRSELRSAVGRLLCGRWPTWVSALLAMLAVLLGPTLSLRAGLSSSDVVVVVNSASLNSRTLANHFVSLRQIPSINVVVLNDIPDAEVINVEQFREKILRPLLAELQRRKLLGHIQCIAYSADFPTAIDISDDLKGVKDRHAIYTPVGSINALTYLYALVLAKDPSYISLQANSYARRELSNYFTNPGGAATEAQWEQIQADIAGGQHGVAADQLKKLLESQPHQFPVAYLAASEAAQAGDHPEAIRLLREAVAKGWNAGRYLQNDKRFAAVRDEADFQVLELLLDEGIKEWQPAQAFDARVTWTPNGVAVMAPQFGSRYLLSTVLGVTRNAGTTLAEAVAALKRSAPADYTHPQGGFYFSLTGDVRTTTRQWGYVSAVDDLQQLGFTAEVVPAVLPKGKTDILGIQFGTANYSWASSGCELLPGALADNLTSMGGVMKGGGGQTTLSEMVRAGAAGSSGTVTEPYALQEKFPHAQMYVAYARGASLAEAFYSYVTGPYQLLIVGDPLCQPFSHAPQPHIDRSLHQLSADEPLHLEVESAGVSYGDWLELAQPVAQRTEPLVPAAVRLLLDGVNPQVAPMQSRINIALKGVPAGYHEIVLQFVAEGPLSPRSSAVVPLWIGAADSLHMELAGAEPLGASVEPQGATRFSVPIAATQQVSLQAGSVSVKIQAAELPGVERVSLWHDSEQLEVVDGSQGEFAVGLERVGMGPVRLQARAELGSGQVVHSQPLWLDVIP